MPPDRRAPTDAELRAAYTRSGVEALGISLDAALADPAMRASLVCMANSDRRWAAHALGTGSRRLEHMAREAS